MQTVRVQIRIDTNGLIRFERLMVTDNGEAVEHYRIYHRGAERRMALERWLLDNKANRLIIISGKMAVFIWEHQRTFVFEI